MSYPPHPWTLLKRKRPEETLPPVVIDEKVPTEEQSFGREFNLIRAVDEFGNKRITDIDKRLTLLQIEKLALEKERAVLVQLTTVVNNFKENNNV